MTGKMQCFSYLQTVDKSFFEEKNVEKCHFSYPPVEITPKILANFASLNSSIAFGDLRLGGCLRTPCPQAPARAQSPRAILELSDANFARIFGVILAYENQGLYLRINGHHD